jgi:hypothetical protein
MPDVLLVESEFAAELSVLSGDFGLAASRRRQDHVAILGTAFALELAKV